MATCETAATLSAAARAFAVVGAGVRAAENAVKHAASRSVAALVNRVTRSAHVEPTVAALTELRLAKKRATRY